MTQQHISEDLLNKLNKLKNLQEGAEAVGSFQEAANAAEKYQTLLLKNNLSDEEVMQHGVKSKIQMLCSEFDLTTFFAYKAADWAEKLINSVSYYCLCNVVRHKNYRCSILGEKQNVATIFFVVEQLVSKIHNAFTIAWKNYTGNENNRLFRRGFLIGAVDAIASKMNKQEAKLKIEVGNGNMSLMIVNKRELATRFMEEKFPRLRTLAPKSQSLSGVGGYEKGHEAGSNMKVDKGLSGAVQNKLGNSK